MAIKSLADFIKQCFAYQREGDSHKKRCVFFRGQNREYPRVLPSIYRGNELIKHEDRIYREIIAEYPAEMALYRTTIEKQIFMQHYDLPSRILDVSKNPLVGLFFACYQEKETQDHRDGVVYVYSVPDDEIAFCDSDSVTAIINLCKRPYDFSIRGIKRLDRDAFNKEEAIQNLVHEAREDKPYFQNLVLPETLESVICIHPAMNNTRIIRQDGYFFVFGIDGEKKNCADIKPQWEPGKIHIPAGRKKDLLKDLERLNITEAFLYADYKHLGRHIQRKYQ